MLITDHTVQNVLRTYSRQLQRTTNPSSPKQGDVKQNPPKADRLLLSEEGKKKLIFEYFANKTKAYIAQEGEEKQTDRSIS